MILLYLCGTIQFGILYNSGGAPLLVGFTNLDLVGDHDDRNCIADYLFILGSRHVTWIYKKQ
jgi:hypothetical protein